MKKATAKLRWPGYIHLSDKCKKTHNKAEKLNEEAKLVLHDTIATMNFRENHDWNEIRNQIRKPLRNFFYKKTMRTPMILPIVFRV